MRAEAAAARAGSRASPQDEPLTLVAAQEKIQEVLESLVQEVGNLRKDFVDLASFLQQRGGRRASGISWCGDGTADAGKAVGIDEAERVPQQEVRRPSGLHDVSDNIVDLTSSCVVDLSCSRVSKFNRRELDNDETKDGHFIAANLPLDWPVVVKIRKSLQQRDSKEVIPSVTAENVWKGISVDEDRHAHEQSRSFMHHFRNPNSRLNVVQEMFGLCVLVYDLTIVPWTLAWEVDVEGALKAFSFISLIFWTIDICMSFLRGFYNDGELITSSHLVAKHYIRTWFFPDFTIVFCEWISVVLGALQGKEDSEGSTDSMKILRLVKMSKLLRLLGALRIVRLARIIEGFMQRSISENYRVVLRVGSLFWFILWLNHMLSCAWFAIGRAAPSDTGGRWIEFSWATADGSLMYMETDGWYQYITALHWAMAQTTLGAMEITSANSWERIFNILCLMKGLLFGSTLVSSLSATMVEVQMRGRDRAQKLQTLRRYLTENAVDKKVALQVQRQIIERLSQKDKLTQDDVVVLGTLSPSLRQDLHAEICKPYLLSHPLLRTWASMDAAWFRKFCSMAVETIFVRSKDEVFVAGSAASSAYCIMAGRCKYLQEPDTSAIKEATTVEIEQFAWICESALWSEWTHVGTAEAATPLQMLSLKAESFWEVLQSHIVVNAIALEYCQSYHRRIVAAKPPQASYPTDLEVPFTDHGDLVCSLTHELQEHIGGLALNCMEQRLFAARTSLAMKGLAKLRKEVKDGRSVVVLNGSGEAERVVSVVVLSLTRSDSRAFVQLGKYEEGKASSENVPDCQLPAIKRHRSEMTSDALQRLLSTKLHFLQDNFEIDNVENLIETKASQEFGVRTRYMRKVCNARLTTAFEAPECWVNMEQFEAEGGDVEVSQKMRIRIRSEVVYYLEAEGKGFFYAWLHPLELARLRTPAGEPDLRVWLSALQRPLQSAHHDEGQEPHLGLCSPAPSDSDDDSHSV